MDNADSKSDAPYARLTSVSMFNGSQDDNYGGLLSKKLIQYNVKKLDDQYSRFRSQSHRDTDSRRKSGLSGSFYSSNSRRESSGSLIEQRISSSKSSVNDLIGESAEKTGL